MKEENSHQEQHPFTNEEIKAILQVNNKKRLEKRWKTIIAEENNATPTSKIVPLKTNYKKWLSMAASLALIIGFWGLYQFNTSPTYNTTQDLVAYHSSKLNLTLPSLKRSENSNFKRGLKSLDENNQLVQMRLDIEQSIDTLVDAHTYYQTLGEICFKQNDYKAAIDYFKRFLNDPKNENATTRDKALKYSGLSYAGDGQLDRAKEQLRAYGDYKPGDAEELLKILETIERRLN